METLSPESQPAKSSEPLTVEQVQEHLEALRNERRAEQKRYALHHVFYL